MKRAYTAVAIALIAMLPACTTKSAAQLRRSEAWSRCANSPTPETRNTCIETEIALIEARDRSDAESRARAVQDAEDRQAKLEASGVPRDAARQTTESPIDIP